MTDTGIHTAPLSAPISDIQRFCVHDGPGIRTVVFFKGCPLRCKWCQNPETQDAKPQLMVLPNLCIGCGVCVQACPHHALEMDGTQIVMNRSRCTVCGACAKTCYAGARRIVGASQTVEEIERLVLTDEVFYHNTGGGVTLSGGEVTLYPAFAQALLRKLQARGVHTAIETCGHCSWPAFEQVLQHTDLVLYDLKHTNAMVHQRSTGVDNILILENLRRIRRMGKAVILRFPLIPGVNDGAENLRKTAELAREYGIEELHLLGFHQLGENKWYGLDMDYQCAAYPTPEDAELRRAAELMERLGLRVNIGGSG